MFWYNGQLFDGNEISLSIDNPGLLYGASVFTTMRVYDHNLDHPLSYWQAHCQRLFHSIESFNWLLPRWSEVRAGAEAISKSFPVVRVCIFPDGKEWVTGRNLPPNLERHRQEGVIGWVSSNPIHRRYKPEHKTGNYLGAWLACGEAQKLGARDAILTDDSGNWLETSTGNLWGWRDGQWFTPPINDLILPGISRSHWLRVMESASIAVCETQWTTELMEGMSAIAYSNCAVELLPFREIQWGDRTLILDPTHQSIRRLVTIGKLIS